MTGETVANIVSIAPIVLLVGGIVYLLSKIIIARRWNQHRVATVGKWEAAGIEFVRGPVGGQFGGLESMGAKAVVRGIGLVMMTDKDLRVTRAAPPGWWSVTYKQIKGVTIQGEFLGQKAKETPFIVVRFVQDGQADRLAFKVKDYQTWAKELAKAARVSLKDQRGK